MGVVLATYVDAVPTAAEVAAVNDNLDYSVMETFGGKEHQMSDADKAYLADHRQKYLG